jgi:hypothetical protein
VSIGPDDLTKSALDGLTNGDRGGIWYSVACWSAAMDHDTFGEHWLRNDAGGGVAYVGNSRYGWGCPGYPGECVSDLFSQQFVNSLLVEELCHAGVVHADAKHHFVGVAGMDDYTRYAMYELNLLGDPEMPIWTDRPRPLVVVCPGEVEIVGGEAEIAVTVTSGGSPVAGATVCLARWLWSRPRTRASLGSPRPRRTTSRRPDRSPCLRAPAWTARSVRRPSARISRIRSIPRPPSRSASGRGRT